MPRPVQPIPTANSDFVFPGPQAFLSKRQDGGPERFAQEALGHNSKAVHRAYAKRALMKMPSLEDYEQRAAEKVEPAATIASTHFNFQGFSLSPRLWLACGGKRRPVEEPCPDPTTESIPPGRSDSDSSSPPSL